MSEPVTVHLKRMLDDPSVGTFGRLFMHEFSCYTIERPWLENRPWVSCIPKGRYALVKGRYNRGGYDCWEVQDVPSRTHIKIHKGNTYQDVQGCISPGMRLGCLDGFWSVQDSAKAFDAFMDVMEQYQDRKVELVIK